MKFVVGLLALCSTVMAGPLVVNQAELRPAVAEPLEQVGGLDEGRLASGVQVAHLDGGLTIYRLVPTEWQQGWQLELFDVNSTLDTHYHHVQTQFVLVTEGVLQLWTQSGSFTRLAAGQYAVIPPEVPHKLVPEGGPVRLMALDMPGFIYPDDTSHDRELPFHPVDKVVSKEPFFVDTFTQLERPVDRLPALSEDYYVAHFDNGNYGAYELVQGTAVEGRWSTALLEIMDSPYHYHEHTTELFVVVNGELNIIVDGENYHLMPGQSVRVLPGAAHQLQSALDTPVRVLCIDFTAFDPTDFYVVE
jgi:mannose-6-phosphate isomerase-like protein (cupin superfamily)